MYLPSSLKFCQVSFVNCGGGGGDKTDCLFFQEIQGPAADTSTRPRLFWIFLWMVALESTMYLPSFLKF